MPKEDHSLDRRDLLKTVGAAAGASFAGCSGNRDTGPPSSEEEDEQTDEKPSEKNESRESTRNGEKTGNVSDQPGNQTEDTKQNEENETTEDPDLSLALEPQRDGDFTEFFHSAKVLLKGDTEEIDNVELTLYVGEDKKPVDPGENFRPENVKEHKFELVHDGEEMDSITITQEELFNGLDGKGLVNYEGNNQRLKTVLDSFLPNGDPFPGVNPTLVHDMAAIEKLSSEEAFNQAKKSELAGEFTDLSKQLSVAANTETTTWYSDSNMEDEIRDDIVQAYDITDIKEKENGVLYFIGDEVLAGFMTGDSVPGGYLITGDDETSTIDALTDGDETVYDIEGLPEPLNNKLVLTTAWIEDKYARQWPENSPVSPRLDPDKQNILVQYYNPENQEVENTIYVEGKSGWDKSDAPTRSRDLSSWISDWSSEGYNFG